MHRRGGEGRRRPAVWTWDRLLELRRRPRLVLVVSLAAVGVIALGDLLTGPYLVFATFYLLPVVAVAWVHSRAAAMVVGFVAAVAGVTSTALDPGEVTAPIYLWNGTFRFVTYALIAILVDAERRAAETIRRLSAVDPLTGLLNRRSFYERAQVELQRARRDGRPLALVYVDLDDLKARNDTAGHQAGDELIVAFAQAATATLRATDLLARIGGDEFCFLLPDQGPSEANDAVERLRAAMGGVTPAPIAASIGVAAGAVPAGADIDALVHRCDELMYAAKVEAKGSTRFGALSG